MADGAAGVARTARETVPLRRTSKGPAPAALVSFLVLSSPFGLRRNDFGLREGSKSAVLVKVLRPE